MQFSAGRAASSFCPPAQIASGVSTVHTVADDSADTRREPQQNRSFATRSRSTVSTATINQRHRTACCKQMWLNQAEVPSTACRCEQLLLHLPLAGQHEDTAQKALSVLFSFHWSNFIVQSDSDAFFVRIAQQRVGVSLHIQCSRKEGETLALLAPKHVSCCSRSLQNQGPKAASCFEDLQTRV